jgi:hypothetical protein
MGRRVDGLWVMVDRQRGGREEAGWEEFFLFA